MRVGRDVHERLISRVTSGLKLVAGERAELVVRLHGKNPAADCLVITNARVVAIDTAEEPLKWICRQVLADEIVSWRLTRKFRSRLTVTCGYGQTLPLGSSLSVYDDDVVDEQLTALVGNRAHPDTAAAVKALRAEAHWVSSAYGRSLYVLDRVALPASVAEAVDLDLVERQLSQFDYWPESEVRRHLATCLPAGGCSTVATDGSDSGSVEPSVVDAVGRAVVTIDVRKLKKSAGDEAGVLQELMSAAAHIRATPAWGSNYLDDHGLRIELNDEVRDIALRCHQAANLRAEVGEKPDGRSATGARAAMVHDASVASLDSVVRSLDERVRQLTSYRDRLRALSRELDDAESAHRMDDAAERVAKLAVDTVGDSDLTESLAGLVPTARGADDPIPAAVEALREDVERLNPA